jgi:tetratricopeptide (TPR) repeat protein
MHHEALSLLEEALEAIQCLPPDAEILALKHVALSGIADAHLALYNNQAAMVYLQTLAEGEDASWRTGALIRMAGAQEKDSEFDKAIELWKKVRREEERTSGMDALDVLCMARKIAALYLRVGNTGQALNWTQGALAGMRRCADPEAKMQELRTLGLMSSIHWNLGDLESALTCQRESTTGLESLLGESNEETLGASLELAEIYDVLGHEREALQWYKKAIAGYKSKLGDRSVQVMKAEQKVRGLERKGVVAETTL